MKAKHLFPLALVVSGAFVFGAAFQEIWKRSEVTAVVLVKPGIGGFEPTEGSTIGNTWTKDSVKPVVFVKPGIGGFVPTEGSSIGNTWRKDEVTPVVVVEPGSGGFVLFGASAGTAQATSSSGGSSTNQPAIIESKVAGEFNGWEGETIVKLENGQIWKQSEYYYKYRYAYRPEVLVLKRSGGYEMKVDGIDKSVRVERLK